MKCFRAKNCNKSVYLLAPTYVYRWQFSWHNLCFLAHVRVPSTQCTRQDFAFSESVAELAKVVDFVAESCGTSQVRASDSPELFSVPFTLYCTCSLSYCDWYSSDYAISPVQGDEQNKERKDSHLTKNKNDGLGLK